MSRTPKFNTPSGTPPAQLQMDRDAITKNPADFNRIINFGGTQVAALGNLATRMIQVQGKFNTTVNELVDKQERLAKQIEELTSAAGGGPRLHDLKASFEAMMHTLVAIEAAKKEADDIGRERVQIAQDLRHYTNTGSDILDEYSTRHIPGAADAKEKTLLEKRKSDFTDRMVVIESARSSSVICAQQVRMMVETMDDMIERIEPMLAGMKDLYRSAKLDFEEKESARRLSEAIEAFSQGTTASVTVKKPLQFRPKP